ncbi:hypothetical protein FLACOL7796_04702 [Flavobacterium collinsii]|uniref:DNA (cytosine-5-)-methyltransferase n=1 Tax=Flavobacterium collinsii TaxID=1114861 RepID=A0ABN7ER89_9FLAO|nr:hypothetical protein FLACOL7796_04702 [Flavobacterium collinsii]
MITKIVALFLLRRERPDTYFCENLSGLYAQTKFSPAKLLQKLPVAEHLRMAGGLGANNKNGLNAN